MANETSPGVNVPENPLLAKLLLAGGGANATTLRGYVGPPRAAGYINLYPSLDDLSESLEIAVADVLQAAAVPESVMPFGATILWAKKDAQITHRRGETAESINIAEVRKGRLRIQVPMRRQRQADCHSPPCFNCQSRCITCMSGPNPV